jgi:hypothetical protein
MGIEPEGFCPYCNLVLDKQPKRNRACPGCGKWMLCRGGAYFTFEEVVALEAEQAAEKAELEQKQLESWIAQRNAEEEKLRKRWPGFA